MSNTSFYRLNFDTSLLDNLLAHIALIDENGVVLRANKAWKSFDERPVQIDRPSVDENMISMLQQAIELGNDYALKLLLGTQKVLNGEQETYSLIYPVAPGADALWFSYTISASDEKQSEFIIIQEEVTSSVRSKQKKREAENRYQIQFEQSLDGILITDTHGNILDANPAACTILGREKQNLLQCTRSKIIDTNDPNYIKALKKRKKSGTYKLETTLKHKKGYPIPAELSSRAYRTKDGSLRAIVSFRDISRRKSAENELLKTKHFTESALNSIPGVFFVLDRQGNFVRWNNNMVTKFGYSAVELSELNATDFALNEDHKAQIQSRIEQCINKGELTFETRVNGKNGIQDYFMLTKRFVEDDNVFIVGSGINITETKQAEQEKRKNRLLMQQLFKNAPMGIAILDTKSKIQEVNSEFEALFGYSEQEITGQNIDELLAPDQKSDEAEHISEQTIMGKKMQAESIRIDKSGREIPVLIGGVPVEMDGEVIAIYAIYVDVSEQYQYQHRLEKSLAEKETLLSELHHRVKNNLALINSMLELQMYSSNEAGLTKELTHTKNRILTIAFIHEVLYQSSSLTEIQFATLINKLLDSDAIQKKMKLQNISLDIDCDKLILDINQAIPCGLYLNELLSLIFDFSNPKKDNKVVLKFRQYGQKIHIILEGTDIVACPKAVKNHQSLHNILIETLAKQLKGTMLWAPPETGYQKFELIFDKKRGYGPARELLEG